MSPIHPDSKDRYPPDWREISLRIREEVGWKCEWCGRPDKRIAPYMTVWDDHHGDVEIDSNIILTVAHLNHQPEDCRRENLRALCQRCHNRHDAPFRAANRKRRRMEAAGQQKLEM